jgi:hypothetical protein
MDYRQSWDLSTIPNDVWASENGRRTRPAQPRKPVLKPCKGCGTELTAQERRKACKICGHGTGGNR